MLVLVRYFSYTPDASFSDEFSDESFLPSPARFSEEFLGHSSY